MVKNVELPFKNRIFFLDIKNLQNRYRLRNYVAKLGGTVGEFFDGRVKYLITDRHQKEWILKEKSLNANQEPQAPETPIKKLSDLLPRGKQLALRASSQPSNNTNTNATQPTTDVIGLAIKRGIKILQAQSVLNFCFSQISEFENPCSNAPAQPKPATSKHFKGFFIKVEDSEEKYRPSAKEFAEWPQIYPRNGEPKCAGPTPVRKQNNEQYCEICNMQFKNVTNHLYSSAHQSQLKLKDNYKNLFSVIRSLPKWEGVLDESEDTQNQSEDSPISTHGSNGSFLALHDYIANNNKNSVTVNLSVHNSKNNHTTKNVNLIYNNDRIKTRKFVGKKLVDKFNFDQLFSDDDEDVNTDEISASCFTPPLLPPLLYPELGEDNFQFTDVDYDYDKLESSSEKDVSLEF